MLLIAFYLLFSHCHVQLFVTPWTAARQTSLSFAISQSWLRFKASTSWADIKKLLAIFGDNFYNVRTKDMLTEKHVFVACLFFMFSVFCMPHIKKEIDSQRHSALQHSSWNFKDIWTWQFLFPRVKHRLGIRLRISSHISSQIVI